MCEGEIDLISGNKETLDISQFLKRSLYEGSFFLEYYNYILNPKYKNIYAFFTDNERRHSKLVI